MAKPQAVTQSTAQKVQALLTRNHAALAAAMPKHVSADRLARVAVNAIAQNPKLQECTAISLMRAITVSGMLGLEPNTPLQHAYLVPFRNTRDGTTEVQLMIGYRGLIDLARRSGEILTITAHCVYANDEFDYELGLNPFLKHKPVLDTDRGDFRCVYAIYKGKDGAEDFEVMSKSEIEKIRKASKASDSPAWKYWADEMARKSAIRRLCKRIPMSLELAMTVSADDRSSGVMKSEDVDTVLKLEDMDIPVEAESTPAPAPTEDKAPESAAPAKAPAAASEPAPKKKPGRPKGNKKPPQAVAPPTQLTDEEKAALVPPPEGEKPEPAAERKAPEKKSEPEEPQVEQDTSGDPPIAEDYDPTDEEVEKLKQSLPWVQQLCMKYGVLYDDLKAAMVEWGKLPADTEIRNGAEEFLNQCKAMPGKVAKLVLKWKAGEVQPKTEEAEE